MVSSLRKFIFLYNTAVVEEFPLDAADLETVVSVLTHRPGSAFDAFVALHQVDQDHTLVREFLGKLLGLRQQFRR